MTGMSDAAWNRVKQVGAQVSIAFPIEMNMRHGMPPIVRMQSMGMEPSLSTDVEVTMTADFFTQMRSAMNLQRVVVNQMILDSPNGNQNLPDFRNWELPQSAVTVPSPPIREEGGPFGGEERQARNGPERAAVGRRFISHFLEPGEADRGSTG
jgi:hypothetical protein